MRIGLALSSLLHLSLIGFGLFTLAGQKLEHDPLDIESIAVDLVPIGDKMALREGEAQASRSEAPAPKPTQKPEINNEARHVGDGQVDSAAPLKPKERPREVEATPPPSGTRQAEAEPAPAPPEKIKTQTPPEKLPEQNQAAAEVKEATPAPPSPEEPAAIATPPEETAPATEAPAPLETAATIPSLPQNVPQPRQKPKPAPPAPPRQQTVAATPPPPQQRGEETLDNILEQTSELIDRTPTQGGGMRRSEQAAGAGATRTIGDNQRLSQTIQNVIVGCIREKANIGILMGSQSYDLVVRVSMRLNRDGSIDGVPDLTPSGGEAAEREISVTQGYAALARCSPFPGLPPELYDNSDGSYGWNYVILNWRPLD